MPLCLLYIIRFAIASRAFASCGYRVLSRLLPVPCGWSKGLPRFSHKSMVSVLAGIGMAMGAILIGDS